MRSPLIEELESEDQAELLRVAGCDYGQGFVVGLPMPADAAVQHRLKNASGKSAAA